MKRPSCPRSFEVEALRNGRLTGPERASFERHLGTCVECSRYTEALAALGEALRAASNDDVVDELHVRRERTRLLAAFDRTLMTAEGPPRPWRPLLWPALAVLAAALLILWRALPAGPSAGMAPNAVPSAASSTIVHANPNAVWSQRREHGREILVLDRGALHVRVRHDDADGPSREPRLLVMLPDGELEDLGTVFTVIVEGGRTTHVRVEEGSVLLRVRGEAPVAIEAGRTWTPQPPALPSGLPSSTASSNGAAAIDPVPRAPHAPIRSEGSGAPPSDASEDFRRALAALNGGDPALAATRFARFLDRYPRDARAEDAAYLRVLAFQKAGDTSAMKRAGESYLRRYPAGFRRTEIQNLVR
jgi:hypothetical protein